MENVDFKFRAWDNKEKKWLLGYELPNLGGFSLFGECILGSEWGSVLSAFIFSHDGRELEDLRVMQYTGIKDKNGKEIYADDILKDTNSNLFRVYNHIGGFVVKANYWMKDLRDLIATDELILEPLAHPQMIGYIEQCEIIGNIYETPNYNMVNKYK